MIPEAIIILLVVIIIFIVTYLLNKRIPKPDGCELSDKCETCQNTSCYVKNNERTGENNNERQ
jgi:hypothetical protein